MRVTCIQLEYPNRSKAESLQHVLGLLDEARGSDLILLPEIWPCGYFAYDRYAPDSETIDGPLVNKLREKARDLKTCIFTGSFVERDGDQLFNTCALIGPSGDILARYRKVHVFGFESEERKRLARGTEVAVADTPFGRAGLAICYDLRFPELFRRMVDQGAEFFLVAAAWPSARRDAWKLFCRARAHENLAYLFACNAAGTSHGVEINGCSVMVDPWGKILAEGGQTESLISCDVDPTAAKTLRSQFPALDDRVLK
ncbi:MAG TPA: nitrilase-related carbon-nitrogen hydrolase [Pirellulaceae bacterium]|jgi:predicted amidohydrolase